MGGLNTSLYIGIEALNATQGTIDTTSNNIANANTPGYTEEVAQLSQNALSLSGGQVSGGGVSLGSIQSVQDQLVNLQIQQQTSLQSGANTESAGLQQIQTYFTTTGTDIDSALTAFSTSLAALSASPTNAGTQQGVLSSGQNLAQAFNTTAEGLKSAQSSADSLVTSSVAQVNTLTQQVAKLNGQISQLTASGQNSGSTQDQLNQALQQLAGLASISVTQTSAGDTITIGNGTPLVMGNQSFALQTTAGSNGFRQVLDSSGNNITSVIQGGQLGGAIQLRDQVVSGMLSQLNSLATQFPSSFNSAQTQGLDSNGNPGQAFFSVPINPNNAASGIAVSISSPSLIAINSTDSSSSNSNVANLAAVMNNPLPSNSATSLVGTTSAPLTSTTSLTSGSITTISDSTTGQTFSFTAGASSTLGDLQTAITGAISAGTLSAGTSLSFNSNGQAVISTTEPGDELQVSTNDSILKGFASTSGQTPGAAYASLVFSVGTAASDASTQSAAIGANLLQLTNQLGAATGVNIDTETANLIRFQTAYEAAARIVSTIQQLNTDTINMIS